jgi:hypothetical protein
MPEEGEHGQGTGKTKLVQAAAQLAGGSLNFTKPPDSADEVQKRLFSDNAQELRVVFLDNVKVSLFHWDELEILITERIISGRKLYAGEGRRPNNLVYVLTTNDTKVSRDMAERVRVIRLKRPEYAAEWERTLFQFLKEHRWDIIADIAAEFGKPAHAVESKTRWAEWDEQVLGRVTNPDACQKVILERQGDINDSQEEAEYMRDALAEQLKLRDIDPLRHEVLIEPTLASSWVRMASPSKKLGGHSAMRYLYNLKIPEVTKYRDDKLRACHWKGTQCPDGGRVKVLGWQGKVEFGDAVTAQ